MPVNGLGLPCLQVLLAQRLFSVASSDHTTRSRNIKPEVVFKVQKMDWCASFCLIMGPFKGAVPVFARLWPVRPPWGAPRRHLTLADLAILGLSLGLLLQWGSRVGHPSNSWACCLKFLSPKIFLEWLKRETSMFCTHVIHIKLVVLAWSGSCDLLKFWKISGNILKWCKIET